MNRFFSRSYISLCSVAILLVSFSAFGQPLQDEKDARAIGREARMEKWRSWRYGLFIHWGPYSKLAGTYDGKNYGANGEWIMRSAKISREDYRKVAESFEPKHYDPKAIVAFAKECGFRYIIITAKHYDGFALFKSEASGFNAVDILPSKRDLLREFADACKEAGMPFGVSYALDRDWYHPGGNTLGPPWDETQKGDQADYLEKLALPQIRELIRDYDNLSILIFDQDRADGMLPDVMRLLQKEVSRNIITPFKFGGLSSPDYTLRSWNVRHQGAGGGDWQKLNTITNSWGYIKEGNVWREGETILNDLVTAASGHGNYLLNIGLDDEGRVPEPTKERLRFVGNWLAKNGDSIYGTRGLTTVFTNFTTGVTARGKKEEAVSLYLHLKGQSDQEVLLDGLLTKPVEARILGAPEILPIKGRLGAWSIELPKLEGKMMPVVELKFEDSLKFGQGPITADRRGIFDLNMGSVTCGGKQTQIGRTAWSPELRLTGLSGESETASWTLYSESSSQGNVTLLAEVDDMDAEKKLRITINGKPSELLQEADSSNGKQAEPIQFKAENLSLVKGLNQVVISGSPDDEQTNSIQVVKVTFQIQ